jgi:hypothetical protein
VNILVTLEIEINNEDLKIVSKRSSVVQSTVNDSFVKFTFSSDWNDYIKTAKFENKVSKIIIEKVIDVSSISIPPEILTDCGTVSLVIKGINGSTVRYTKLSCFSCFIVDETISGNPSNITIPSDWTSQVVELVKQQIQISKATASQLGVVKIGENIKINENGEISVDKSSYIIVDTNAPSEVKEGTFFYQIIT